MKKIYLVLALFISINGVVLGANSGTASGKIKTLLAISTNSGWAEVEGSYWLTIEGVTVAGGCATNGQLVKFYIIPEDKNLYSMALSAKMSGAEIGLDWSDDLLYAGYCRARDIHLN